MFIKKIFFLLILCIASLNIEIIQAEGTQCRDEESCLNDDNCQCYCSVKCDFRKKDFEKGDRPVFVENDPNGKFCYCKQWDADNYNKRHCDVKAKAKTTIKSSKKKQKLN